MPELDLGAAESILWTQPALTSVRKCLFAPSLTTDREEAPATDREEAPATDTDTAFTEMLIPLLDTPLALNLDVSASDDLEASTTLDSTAVPYVPTYGPIHTADMMPPDPSNIVEVKTSFDELIPCTPLYQQGEKIQASKQLPDKRSTL
ncbi:unnamed protein product [Merluccius merluccius]